MTPTVMLLVAAPCLVCSALVSLLTTPWVRQWARQRDFVDRPGSGAHKKHARVVPLGGGIAITLAIFVPLGAALLAAGLLYRWGPGPLAGLLGRVPGWTDWAGGAVAKTPQALGVIAGALMMHLVGIIDDHRPLSAPAKLAMQAGVALMLALWFGVRAAEALGPVASVLLTVLWIVTLTNAFNFMDNMDGLTAGVAGLAALLLAGSGLMAGQVFVPCLFLMVAGAAMGFLVYNFPPASIFMGDAGSLVLGYFLAVCTVLTTFYNPDQLLRPAGVLVPMTVFAVPLYDLITVIGVRLREGSSIFKADRRHFSHRLVRLGKTPRGAVLTIYLATAATGLPALLLPKLSWPAAGLVFGQCLCVLGIIALLEFRGVDEPS